MQQERAYKLYLLGGREYDITYDQTIQVAKCILFLPEWKKIKIAGVVFSTNEIDYERKSKELKPQQSLIDLETVEKAEKKSRKSIDF